MFHRRQLKHRATPSSSRRGLVTLLVCLLAAAALVVGYVGTPPPAPSASPQPVLAAPPGAGPSLPATLPRSEPVRLRAPAIGVDSDLMDLGLQDDGTLEVPPDGFPAGWYTGAPTPGELGPAVVAGHVDWDGRPGVFSDLSRLRPQDEVTVVREDGTAALFRVTRVEAFPKDAFPTEAVYGNLDHAGLRLVTCSGAFDSEARSYVENTIVFADYAGLVAA